MGDKNQMFDPGRFNGNGGWNSEPEVNHAKLKGPPE